MRKYVVECTNSGTEVLVEYSECVGDSQPLRSVYSNFGWGYEGAGPHSLACALLSDLVAGVFGYDFMLEAVSKVSSMEDGEKVVVYKEDQMLSWLKAKLNSM